MFKKFPNDPSLWQKVKHFDFSLYDWMPRGWVYQNMATVAKIDRQIIDSIDVTNGFIQPQKADATQRKIDEIQKHFSLYAFLAGIGFPNFAEAFQFLGRNQSLVDEAQVACALERYRFAHGGYPETLGQLVPQFIAKLPHDIIGGRPLHYRRTGDGQFLLYSVGWNKTDDGGQVVLKADGSVDREKGDWVWR